MIFYFAPMEGLTGYIYRNAHKSFFNHIDKYFSPFIVASQNNIKSRELNDILPEHNPEVTLIPQLLTNNSRDFIHTSKTIRQLGYQEINLNLGCPSPTVVSKNRGSGLLADKERLDQFLEEIFSAAVTDISIKTRIGRYAPEEFYELIQIFNKYPVKELIIHPRTREDYYKNKPNLDVFQDAVQLSKNPVCYNGDIFQIQDYQEFIQRFPGVEKMMVGRGLLANPGLVSFLQKNEEFEKERLKEFHDNICQGYQSVLFGDRNVLFKMKELWFYLIRIFPDSEKYVKKIKKAERLSDYQAAVENLFQEREISMKGSNSGF